MNFLLRELLRHSTILLRESRANDKLDPVPITSRARLLPLMILIRWPLLVTKKFSETTRRIAGRSQTPSVRAVQEKQMSFMPGASSGVCRPRADGQKVVGVFLGRNTKGSWLAKAHMTVQTQ
jgi:hypothetical protein